MSTLLPDLGYSGSVLLEQPRGTKEAETNSNYWWNTDRATTIKCLGEVTDYLVHIFGSLPRRIIAYAVNKNALLLNTDNVEHRPMQLQISVHHLSHRPQLVNNFLCTTV